MNHTYRLIRQTMSSVGDACGCGMEHWHNALALTTLLTLLSTLLLEQPGADHWVLQLCHWLDSHCHWITAAAV